MIINYVVYAACMISINYAEVEKQKKRNITLPFTNCIGTSYKAHIGALWQTLIL